MTGDVAHPFESVSVTAAVAQENRMTKTEGTIDAILEHCERIEEHLVTLNGRTLKNETNLQKTNNLITKHLIEVTAREEYPRLLTVESDVKLLKDAAIQDGTVKDTRAKDWKLIVAIGAALTSPIVTLIIALFVK